MITPGFEFTIKKLKGIEGFPRIAKRIIRFLEDNDDDWIRFKTFVKSGIADRAEYEVFSR